MCGTNDQTVQAPGNVVIDGVASGESPGGTGSCALHINKLARQASEFALHSVLIWDVGLTKVEMKLVTDQLTAQLKGPVVQDWEGVVSSERLQSFLAANPPASAYFGKDYNADQGRLRDRSGNHRHAVVSGNGAEVASAEGDGALREISFLRGETSTVVQFPPRSIPSTFTICSVTRWTSLLAAKQQRILSCYKAGALNWLHGHSANGGRGGPGATYYGNGWKTPYVARGPSSDWVVLCGTNSQEVPRPSNVVWGAGTEIADADGGLGGCALHINDFSQQRSDFALHSVLIWDGGLASNQMKLVAVELTEHIRGPVVPDLSRSAPPPPHLPSY